MASCKRGLLKEEIERLLFQSDDSISETDSDDSEFSDDDGEVENNDNQDIQNDNAGNDNDVTVDYDPSIPIMWSDTDTCARSRLPFTGIPGRRAPISDTADPLEYFNLFFTDDMMDNIVTETNRRAQQLMQSTQLKRRARLNNWVDVTCDELKVLFAMFIYQGIIQSLQLKCTGQPNHFLKCHMCVWLWPNSVSTFFWNVFTSQIIIQRQILPLGQKNLVGK